MAKEGQTTSRLRCRSVYNGVQEVGVVSDGDLERWAAFEEDRSPRVSQTGIKIREERKRVRASKRPLVEDGGNLLVGLARILCLLAGASMSEFGSLQGDRHHFAS